MYQVPLKQCPVNLPPALFALWVVTYPRFLSLTSPSVVTSFVLDPVIHANFATIWVSKCSTTGKTAFLTFLFKYWIQDFL